MSEERLREAVARIVNPRVFERWDDLAARAGAEEADRQYPERNRVFAKADAILALISTKGDWR